MTRNLKPRETGELARAVSLSAARPQDSLQAAQAVLATRGLKPAQRSDAHRARCAALVHAGQYRDGAEAARAAILAAQQANDPLREARAQVALGVASLLQGHQDDAVQALSAALSIAGPQSEIAATALANLGLLAEQLGEHLLSLEFAQRSHALLPAGMPRAAAALNAAATLGRLNRLPEARASAEEALAQLNRPAEERQRLDARAVLAWLDARQGRPATALASLEQVVAEAEAAGLHPAAMNARRLWVEALLMADLPDQAVRMGEQTLADGQRLQGDAHDPDLRLWLAQAHAQSGNWPRAYELLRQQLLHQVQLGTDPAVLRRRQQLLATLDLTQAPADGTGAPVYGVAAGVAKRLGLSVDDTRLLRGIHDGLTNPEIAADMGLSVHAVRNRLSRVMRRLGVGTRTAAARRALELGVLRRLPGQAGPAR